MPVINLHTLPQFSDRMSWLYLEYGRIEKTDNGLIFRDKRGETPLPVAAMSTLLLGPGTVITHRAACAAAEMNCLLTWVGEGAIRMYAASIGGTSQTQNLQHQAKLWADEQAHLAVVRKMYAKRFGEKLPIELGLQEIRGREGARVRAAYTAIGQETGVRWVRRQYDPTNWNSADLPNRCLSSATACLYGVTHAAMVSAGYSAALGFIHTGSPLSFVYDIADLYKPEMAVRIAFEVAANPTKNPEREVRKRCRAAFLKTDLMSRILPDINEVLNVSDEFERLPASLTGRVNALAN